MAECYNKLKTRKVDPDTRQRFILQCLIALFAEDIGLLERYTFQHLLEECKQPADTYDLIGGLFEAMNRKGGNPGGRYKGVRYFNGGIFVEPARIELYPDELSQLREASTSDWSKVSPEIFGTLFEHSMETDARHAFGAHFTSQIDILKIVKPTIADPWTQAIDSAKSGDALLKLLDRLTHLRVLDPACGSGNFLYLAYREMKRLETHIRERLRFDFPATQPTLAHVNARQFFGMDINPFAVELAKVTMMIGRKLAIDELHIADESDLPLDNLDTNFLLGDALITRRADGGAIQTPWPAADVIIGNPPFLGAKRLKPERGADYVNAVRKLYPEVPGMADYCVYWIRRAADHLPECTRADPFAGRAGLVGTQNIRNNQSRVGGLDHVVASGTIVEAVDNQPWSGEAAVHVAIVNWVNTRDTSIVPKIRRLWQVPDKEALRRSRKSATSDVPELVEVIAVFLSSALSDEFDVSTAHPIAVNLNPQRTFQGQIPGHEAFFLDDIDSEQLKARDPRNAELIHPYMTGLDLVTEGRPTRFILDFGRRTLPQAASYPSAFKLIEDSVLPDREAKAEAAFGGSGVRRSHHQMFLRNWWRLSYDRPEMLELLSALPRYIVCSQNTQRQIFAFLDSSIRPDQKLQVFAFADDYSFAVLQSIAHWDWFLARSPRLATTPTYTSESVFGTFPWPQNPTNRQIDAVAAAGREVRRVRAEALAVIPGGLRAVYRTLELPGKHPLKDAHAALDAAVLAAYGFSPKADLLRQLLELNHAVAAKEKTVEAITKPGVPPVYGDHSALITDDCIMPTIIGL